MRDMDIPEDWALYVAWIAIPGNEQPDDPARLDLHQAEEEEPPSAQAQSPRQPAARHLALRRLEGPERGQTQWGGPQ